MMIAGDLIPYMAKIRKTWVLRNLSDRELEKIVAVSEVVLYQGGEKIISQGDEGEYFYALLSGLAEVSVKDLQKEQVSINRIKAGDLFGETAIFFPERRIATVTALEQTAVLRMHREAVRDYFNQYPAAGNKILMVIAMTLILRLKETNLELALAKDPDIDFDYVDSIINDFIKVVE